MSDYEYDVALSFDGADRAYVAQVAAELKAWNRKVFFADDEAVKLWGKDLVEEFEAVYRTRSQYVIAFVSQAYADNVWTRHELRSALARAITERSAYVLLARLDDTELPGVIPTTAYIDISARTPQEFAGMILEKLAERQASGRSLEHSPGWEYLLLADGLRAGVDSLKDARMDHRVGLAPLSDTAAATDLREVAALSGVLLAEIQTHLRTFNRVFRPENTEAALGKPGEAGDAERIEHLANAMTQLYASFLAWAARVRGATVPVEAGELMNLLADYATGPIEQYEAWVDRYCETMRPLIAKLRAGGLDEAEPMVLEFTLKIDVLPGLMERYQAELDRLAATL